MNLEERRRAHLARLVSLTAAVVGGLLFLFTDYVIVAFVLIIGGSLAAAWVMTSKKI